jgi:hypothetical protein
VPGEERRLARPGQEAEVLGVGLGGDREISRGGQRAHLRLGELAEREAQAGDRGGGQAASM